MIMSLFGGLFDGYNKKILKNYKKSVAKINEAESYFESLNDEELKDYFNEIKQSFEEDKVKPEDVIGTIFSLVREASKRILKIRHHDVQVIGALALNDGQVIEMATGEGKTLVATLPATFYALLGGTHVITVNDYLAKRDAELMRHLYEFFGLKVGYIQKDMPVDIKRDMYDSDIVYVTASELGFDYLRDHLVFSLSQKVMVRPLNYVIIDEADSILIDEARTPLIISGSSEEDRELFQVLKDFPRRLSKFSYEDEEDPEGDAVLDRKQSRSFLLEDGISKLESFLIEKGVIKDEQDLYSSDNMKLFHYAQQAVTAHFLYEKERDYIIEDGQIVIISETTGRKMKGRKWSGGLHQCIEAKEGVEITPMSKDLAKVTYQNLFKKYERLSGMSGTVMTDADEFADVYGVNVIPVPTHRPVQRVEHADRFYLTQEEKDKAIVEEIKVSHKKGQPVLVGTESVEYSEKLSDFLNKEGIPHNVLNAKNHEKEAKIISEAGRLGAVTISTSMAGRGTDILLGGNVKEKIQNISDEKEQKRIIKEYEEDRQKVLEAGGLKVIGAYRSDSRRIDNQLKGRAGRQGDPGESVFFVSFEDRILKLFADMAMVGILKDVVEENPGIGTSQLNKLVEKAQEKLQEVEKEVRLQVKKYDDVIDRQREVVYQVREEILALEFKSIEEKEKALKQTLNAFVSSVVWGVKKDDILNDKTGLDVKKAFEKQDIHIEISDELSNEHVIEKLEKGFTEEFFSQKITELKKEGDEVYLNGIDFLLKVSIELLDNIWTEHLNNLEILSDSVQLYGYVGKEPIVIYEEKAIGMFSEMIDKWKEDSGKALLTLKIEFEKLEGIDEVDGGSLSAGSPEAMALWGIPQPYLIKALEAKNNEI